MDKTKYNITRVVRIPQLKLEGGNDYAIKAESEMYDEPSRGTSFGSTVTLMKVVDLETGELCTIVLGTVLKELFTGEDGYAGKCWLIGVGHIEGENKWRDYALAEIDAPGRPSKGA